MEYSPREYRSRSWSPVVEMSRSTGSANERARTGVQLLFPKRTPRWTRS